MALSHYFLPVNLEETVKPNKFLIFCYLIAPINNMIEDWPTCQPLFVIHGSSTCQRGCVYDRERVVRSSYKLLYSPQF